jgi:hypothetical protein
MTATARVSMMRQYTLHGKQMLGKKSRTAADM